MRKAEVQRIIKDGNRLRSLLKEFGLKLSGYDPGVSAFHFTGQMGWDGREVINLVSFDGREWKFIEPLLIELRDFRRKERRKLKK